ncbi:unnamed protein product [Umbelopsis vinacea]
MASLAAARALKNFHTNARPFATQAVRSTKSAVAKHSFPYTPAQSALPPSFIPFACTQGKEYFREAMDYGTAEGFFGLMGNFSSNALPQHGGQASLSMVLNSLEIDPKRTWKGAWRWYSTDLLQACSSANQIQARGITFAEFACLAKTHCQVTQHKPSTTSYSQFLTHLAETTSQADSHLVVSFSRQTLGQTTLTAKTGFATIGGYNPLKKKALLMDSSRAEYPCVWVDTGLLYHAMAEIDPLLGSERGYFLLAQVDNTDRKPYIELSPVINKLSKFGLKLSDNFDKAAYDYYFLGQEVVNEIDNEQASVSIQHKLSMLNDVFEAQGYTIDLVGANKIRHMTISYLDTLIIKQSDLVSAAIYEAMYCIESSLAVALHDRNLCSSLLMYVASTFEISDYHNVQVIHYNPEMIREILSNISLCTLYHGLSGIARDKQYLSIFIWAWCLSVTSSRQEAFLEFRHDNLDLHNIFIAVDSQIKFYSDLPRPKSMDLQA